MLKQTLLYYHVYISSLPYSHRMKVCVVKGYPKWFWIITSTSATRCYCKNFKMAIYIKSTILELEKKLNNILEILFFVHNEHVEFKEASFKSN